MEVEERQKETQGLYVRRHQQGEMAAVIEMGSDRAETPAGMCGRAVRLQFKCKAQLPREASLICPRHKGSLWSSA